MPRLDHRTDFARFSYEVQLLMTLLMAEINTLRQQASLPPRTPQQIQQALRQYIVDHPRPSGQAGG